MCRDHEFYDLKRKRHLSKLLKRTDKTYKLVLHAQNLFEQYRKQVKDEHCSKEAELPVGFNSEEESAVAIRRNEKT